MVVITRTIPGIRYNGIFEYEKRLDLCLILTLLLLLLYPHQFWYVKIPLSVIAISGFIDPRLRISAALWGTSAAIITLATYANWYVLDNHKYLLGYWCIAVFFALTTNQPAKAMSTSARWLIGLVFLLAIIQKTLSVDYLDGAFFYYELLLDERFSGLAKYLGGVPDHIRELNVAARRALINFDSTLTSVRLQGAPNMTGLAVFITWWNFLIQVLIALAFLLPKPTLLARTRDAWLLIFLFTTYLFAPVIGFGWVLAIMGVAQTEPHQVKTRAMYLVAFLFLQIYRIPWGRLIEFLSGIGQA